MYSKESLINIIQNRFSCRTYQDQVIEPEKRETLSNYISRISPGPFGNLARFSVITATETDLKALQGLGTYGFIKNAPGFIVGAIHQGDYNLEDFGFLMEKIILFATELELGTCWLGGTFTKSNFSKKILLMNDEIIPAVTAVGHISKDPRKIDKVIRQVAKSDHRFAWDVLFFDTSFGIPLSENDAGDYKTALETVRLGPSASNRQPWRIIKNGNLFHFYLHRSNGYQENHYLKALRAVDLQRIDLGIAMCHFELTARACRLKGHWKVFEYQKRTLKQNTSYLVTWVDDSTS
jgi:hypothetical protein